MSHHQSCTFSHIQPQSWAGLEGHREYRWMFDPSWVLPLPKLSVKSESWAKVKRIKKSYKVQIFKFRYSLFAKEKQWGMGEKVSQEKRQEQVSPLSWMPRNPFHVKQNGWWKSWPDYSLWIASRIFWLSLRKSSQLLMFKNLLLKRKLVKESCAAVGELCTSQPLQCELGSFVAGMQQNTGKPPPVLAIL